MSKAKRLTNQLEPGCNMRDARPEPATRAARRRRQRRLTLALWWIVLYLAILYLAIRLGASRAVGRRLSPSESPNATRFAFP